MENYAGKVCPSCNAEIKEEDTVTICPSCGAVHHQNCWDENHGCSTPGCPQQNNKTVQAAVVQTNMNNVCLQCGTELQEGHEFCPKCGQKIGATINPDQPVNPANAEKKKLSKKNSTIIIAAAAVFLVIVSIFIISSTMLFGDDKAAYDLVVNASEKFKDPTSVVLMSGSLSDSKGILYAGISATNSYGVRNTNYYSITSTSVLETKNPTTKYMDKTALNIEKINKALDKKFDR